MTSGLLNLSSILVTGYVWIMKLLLNTYILKFCLKRKQFAFKVSLDIPEVGRAAH